MEAGKVYSEIKKEILNLTLKPGTELNLNELAATFNVSRSPVRDAVKELSLENLIDIYPQRGTYVSRIDLSLVEDERFIRLNLELAAAEIFMEKKPEAMVEKMEELIQEQQKAFDLRDSSALLALDDQFHRMIFIGAEKERVFDYLLLRNGSYHRMRVISYMFDSIAQGVINQHRELVNAIRKGDKELFLKTDRHHISKLLTETDSFRSSMPQFFI